jgi:hypothetical protein
MIRALRPTDVLAFLAFSRRNPDNEALRGAIGESLSPSLSGFLGDSIALDTRRWHWVLFDGGSIHGLIAVRSRFGADVWDVERLMLAPEADFQRTLSKLLDHMLAHASDEGVQRVFLRVREDSDSLVTARRMGFQPYTSEQIYVHPAGGDLGQLPGSANGRPSIRPRRPVHHQPIFQLYTSAVPVVVRLVEGMTLQEWRWTDGWQVSAIPWSRDSARRQDYVAFDQDEVVGWLQADSAARMLTMLVGESVDTARDLVAFGLHQLGSSGPCRIPLRDYQSSLGAVLGEAGFSPGDRHVLLARSLAIRVPEAKLVPVQAS